MTNTRGSKPINIKGVGRGGRTRLREKFELIQLPEQKLLQALGDSPELHGNLRAGLDRRKNEIEGKI